MNVGNAVQSDCSFEYAQELAVGAFGSLWLTRLTSGPEMGRVVVARRLPLKQLEASQVERVRDAARMYGGISHPLLVKLLGVHCDSDSTELIWLEEQFMGVPLSKLQELVHTQRRSVPSPIATRLVLDALRASVALRSACGTQNLPAPEQLIFPDSVMVAAYGEGLLAGIAVADLIARAGSIRRHPDLTDVLEPPGVLRPGASREIFTAGAILWKLLLVRGLFHGYSNRQALDQVLHSNSPNPEHVERLDLCVPKPIAEIIRRATARDIKRRYATLEETIGAFENLPSQLRAHDHEVSNWLSEVASDYFAVLQRGSGVRRVAKGFRDPLDSSALDDMMSRHTPVLGFHAHPFADFAFQDEAPTLKRPSAEYALIAAFVEETPTISRTPPPPAEDKAAESRSVPLPSLEPTPTKKRTWRTWALVGLLVTATLAVCIWQLMPSLGARRRALVADKPMTAQQKQSETRPGNPASVMPETVASKNAVVPNADRNDDSKSVSKSNTSLRNPKYPEAPVKARRAPKTHNAGEDSPWGI